MDHLRFKSRSSQNTCRLRKQSGVDVVAVAVKHPCDKPLYQTQIDNARPWKYDFLRVIKRNYVDAPYFEEYFYTLSEIINTPNVLLESLNIETTKWIANLLGVTPTVIYSYQSYALNKYRRVGWASKSNVTQAICARLNASVFSRTFKHPYYPQIYEPFEKDLSVLDALFCIGAEDTRELLKES